jgi:hypothetical protein
MSLWKQSVIVTCTTKEIVVLYRSSYFRLHKTTEKTLLLLPTKTQRYFTGTVWGGVGWGGGDVTVLQLPSVFTRLLLSAKKLYGACCEWVAKPS